ncbi:MAG: hypothetical protein CMO37_00415, partial [Verrucomicrobiaceae bacterium]|nr:hypothetical protein [Verrucomicrobiaceae bacterium]
MRSIVLLLFLFTFNGSLELNANEHGINWEEARQFWAFVSPSKVDPPEIDDREWSRGDIDLFVLS